MSAKSSVVCAVFSHYLRQEGFRMPSPIKRVRRDSDEYRDVSGIVERAIQKYLLDNGPSVERELRKNAWEEFIVPGHFSLFRKYFDFATYPDIIIRKPASELYKEIFGAIIARGKADVILYLKEHEGLILERYMKMFG